MKAFLALLFGLVAPLAIASEKADQKRGDEKDVIVARLPLSIPDKEPETEEFIWDLFSARPETELFIHYSTQEWRKNFDIFSASLISKARKGGFEFKSLEICLRKFLKRPMAHDQVETGYLPIGAYRTTQGTKEVWILFCLWEYANDPAKLVPPPTLELLGETQIQTKPEVQPFKAQWPTVGHICMLTFDIKSIEFIGYVSCN